MPSMLAAAAAVVLFHSDSGQRVSARISKSVDLDIFTRLGL